MKPYIIKKAPLTPRSIISAILALVLFFTQSLFAYSPEKNFWEERRKSRILLSQAGGLPQSGNPVYPRNLPAPEIILPSILKKADIPFDQSSPQSELLSRLVSSLSANGVVRDIRNAQKLNSSRENLSPVVIYIQDVHGQKDAQKNIASMILGLWDLFPDAAMGLEGASGAIDAAPFRSPSQSLNKEVASFFLNTGLVAGPEYAALAALKSPRLWGVENSDLYLKNVKAVRSALFEQKQMIALAEKLKADLAEKKRSFYTPAMLEVDHKREAYLAGSLFLGDYLAYLTSLKPFSPLENFPTISLFLKTWELERSINFPEADLERDRFLSHLINKLEETELRRLVERSAGFKSGTVTFADFYNYLKGCGLKAGLELSKFPQFAKFIQYTLQADAIVPETLLKEADAFEERTWQTLCQTALQKKLVKESSGLDLIEKLVRLNLTTDEWEKVEARIGEIHGFFSPGEKAKLQPARLLPFEEFYEAAQARNRAMVENLLTILPGKPSHPSVTILVAGGFHGEGLKDLIPKNITLIMVAPKLIKVDSKEANEYLSVFTRDKTPLDKLFDSAKISLADTLSLKPLFPDSRSVAVRTFAPELWGLIPRAEAKGYYSETEENPPHVMEVAQLGREIPPLLKGDGVEVALEGPSDHYFVRIISRPRGNHSGTSFLAALKSRHSRLRGDDGHFAIGSLIKPAVVLVGCACLFLLALGHPSLRYHFLALGFAGVFPLRFNLQKLLSFNSPRGETSGPSLTMKEFKKLQGKIKAAVKSRQWDKAAGLYSVAQIETGGSLTPEDLARIRLFATEFERVRAKKATKAERAKIRGSIKLAERYLASPSKYPDSVTNTFKFLTVSFPKMTGREKIIYARLATAILEDARRQPFLRNGWGPDDEEKRARAAFVESLEALLNGNPQPAEKAVETLHRFQKTCDIGFLGESFSLIEILQYMMTALEEEDRASLAKLIRRLFRNIREALGKSPPELGEAVKGLSALAGSFLDLSRQGKRAYGKRLTELSQVEDSDVAAAILKHYDNPVNRISRLDFFMAVKVLVRTGDASQATRIKRKYEERLPQRGNTPVMDHFIRSNIAALEFLIKEFERLPAARGRGHRAFSSIMNLPAKIFQSWNRHYEGTFEEINVKMKQHLGYFAVLPSGTRWEEEEESLARRQRNWEQSYKESMALFPEFSRIGKPIHFVLTQGTRMVASSNARDGKIWVEIGLLDHPELLKATLVKEFRCLLFRWLLREVEDRSPNFKEILAEEFVTDLQMMAEFRAMKTPEEQARLIAPLINQFDPHGFYQLLLRSLPAERMRKVFALAKIPLVLDSSIPWSELDTPPTFEPFETGFNEALGKFENEGPLVRALYKYYKETRVHRHLEPLWEPRNRFKVGDVRNYSSLFNELRTKFNRPYELIEDVNGALSQPQPNLTAAFGSLVRLANRFENRARWASEYAACIRRVQTHRPLAELARGFQSEDRMTPGEESFWAAIDDLILNDNSEPARALQSEFLGHNYPYWNPFPYAAALGLFLKEPGQVLRARYSSLLKEELFPALATLPIFFLGILPPLFTFQSWLGYVICSLSLSLAGTALGILILGFMTFGGRAAPLSFYFLAHHDWYEPGINEFRKYLLVHNYPEEVSRLWPDEQLRARLGKFKKYLLRWFFGYGLSGIISSYAFASILNSFLFAGPGPEEFGLRYLAGLAVSIISFAAGHIVGMSVHGVNRLWVPFETDQEKKLYAMGQFRGPGRGSGPGRYPGGRDQNLTLQIQGAIADCLRGVKKRDPAALRSALEFLKQNSGVLRQEELKQISSFQHELGNLMATRALQQPIASTPQGTSGVQTPPAGSAAPPAPAKPAAMTPAKPTGPTAAATQAGIPAAPVPPTTQGVASSQPKPGPSAFARALQEYEDTRDALVVAMRTGNWMGGEGEHVGVIAPKFHKAFGQLRILVSQERDKSQRQELIRLMRGVEDEYQRLRKALQIQMQKVTNRSRYNGPIQSAFHRAIEVLAHGYRGSGNTGLIELDRLSARGELTRDQNQSGFDEMTGHQILSEGKTDFLRGVTRVTPREPFPKPEPAKPEPARPEPPRTEPKRPELAPPPASFRLPSKIDFGKLGKLRQEVAYSEKLLSNHTWFLDEFDQYLRTGPDVFYPIIGAGFDAIRRAHKKAISLVNLGIEQEFVRRALAIAMMFHMGQPVSESDSTPYLLKLAQAVDLVAQGLPGIGAERANNIQVLATAWLYRVNCPFVRQKWGFGNEAEIIQALESLLGDGSLARDVAQYAVLPRKMGLEFQIDRANEKVFGATAVGGAAFLDAFIDQVEEEIRTFSGVKEARRDNVDNAESALRTQDLKDTLDYLFYAIQDFHGLGQFRKLWFALLWARLKGKAPLASLLGSFGSHSWYRGFIQALDSLLEGKGIKAESIFIQQVEMGEDTLNPNRRTRIREAWAFILGLAERASKRAELPGSGQAGADSFVAKRTGTGGAPSTGPRTPLPLQAFVDFVEGEIPEAKDEGKFPSGDFVWLRNQFQLKNWFNVLFGSLSGSLKEFSALSEKAKLVWAGFWAKLKLKVGKLNSVQRGENDRVDSWLIPFAAGFTEGVDALLEGNFSGAESYFRTSVSLVDPSRKSAVQSGYTFLIDLYRRAEQKQAPRASDGGWILPFTWYRLNAASWSELWTSIGAFFLSASFFPAVAQWSFSEKALAVAALFGLIHAVVKALFFIFDRIFYGHSISRDWVSFRSPVFWELALLTFIQALLYFACGWKSLPFLAAYAGATLFHQFRNSQGSPASKLKDKAVSLLKSVEQDRLPNDLIKMGFNWPRWRTEVNNMDSRVRPHQDLGTSHHYDHYGVGRGNDEFLVRSLSWRLRQVLPEQYLFAAAGLVLVSARFILTALGCPVLDANIISLLFGLTALIPFAGKFQQRHEHIAPRAPELFPELFEMSPDKYRRKIDMKFWLLGLATLSLTLLYINIAMGQAAAFFAGQTSGLLLHSGHNLIPGLLPASSGPVATENTRRMPGPVLAINVMDAGAKVDGEVTYGESLKKITKIIPNLAQRGFKILYLYGGLFAMGIISKELHCVRDPEVHSVESKDETVIVRMENYATRKVTMENGLIILDNHGNSFSPSDMRSLNPQLSDGDIQQDLDELIRVARAHGMDVMTDWIPWRAPDAVTAENYHKFHHRRLSQDELEKWKIDHKKGMMARAEFIFKLLQKNPEYAVKLVTNETGDKEPILVLHPSLSFPHKDQVIPNIFLKEVQDDYIAELKALIDMGVAGVRIDLIHLLLRGHQEGFRNKVSLGFVPPHDELYEPLRRILYEVKSYAREKRVNFTVLGETYTNGNQDYPEMFRKNWEGLVDFVYYKPVFDHYVAGTVQSLRDALVHALLNTGLVVFGSNFDEQSLKNTGGARYGFISLLLFLGRAGLSVMVDFRELIDHSGPLIPIVGPAHPVVNNAELKERREKNLLQLVNDSHVVKDLDVLPELAPGTPATILNTSAQNRYISASAKSTKGDLVIAVNDFWTAAKRGEEIWVGLPDEFLKEAGLTRPVPENAEALLRKAWGGYEVIDAATGERTDFDLFIDKGDGATPYRVKLKLKEADTLNVFLIRKIPQPELSDSFWGPGLRIRSCFLAATRLFVKIFDGIVELWRSSRDWFTQQWGRDALISMPGLLLVTGRFEEARKLMESFASLERNGIIPNRIGDRKNPQANEYDNADVSMWFIQAVKKYVDYTGDLDFAAKMLPTVRNIMSAYENGTGYDDQKHINDEPSKNINRNFMDKEDGLIANPAGATWMNANPHLKGFVTPRNGKAVEINALWYANLRFMHELLNYSPEPDRSRTEEERKHYRELADKVKGKFNEKFWSERDQTLFDVIEGDLHQGAHRPNGLVAISHGLDLLSEERQIKVFEQARQHLITPYGPRSLDPRDSNYKPRYYTESQPNPDQGPDIFKHHKDFAADQGTVWPGLMGIYVDSLFRVRNYQKKSLEDIRGEMRETLEPLTQALINQGTLHQVYDGEPREDGQRHPGGTSSQAWSVAEVFRVLMEYQILPKENFNWVHPPDWDGVTIYPKATPSTSPNAAGLGANLAAACALLIPFGPIAFIVGAVLFAGWVVWYYAAHKVFPWEAFFSSPSRLVRQIAKQSRELNKPAIIYQRLQGNDLNQIWNQVKKGGLAQMAKEGAGLFEWALVSDDPEVVRALEARIPRGLKGRVHAILAPPETSLKDLETETLKIKGPAFNSFLNQADFYVFLPDGFPVPQGFLSGLTEKDIQRIHLYQLILDALGPVLKEIGPRTSTTFKALLTALSNA